jgi:hypothetical protein
MAIEPLLYCCMFRRKSATCTDSLRQYLKLSKVQYTLILWCTVLQSVLHIRVQTPWRWQNSAETCSSKQDIALLRMLDVRTLVLQMTDLMKCYSWVCSTQWPWRHFSSCAYCSIAIDRHVHWGTLVRTFDISWFSSAFPDVCWKSSLCLPANQPRPPPTKPLSVASHLQCFFS